MEEGHGSDRAQQSRWNFPEGGDPLGRDLDGEYRSLNWNSRV
jgi:hypothetical protein